MLRFVHGCADTSLLPVATDVFLFEYPLCGHQLWSWHQQPILDVPRWQSPFATRPRDACSAPKPRRLRLLNSLGRLTETRFSSAGVPIFIWTRMDRFLAGLDEGCGARCFTRAGPRPVCTRGPFGPSIYLGGTGSSLLHGAGCRSCAR